MCNYNSWCSSILGMPKYCRLSTHQDNWSVGELALILLHGCPPLDTGRGKPTSWGGGSLSDIRLYKYFIKVTVILMVCRLREENKQNSSSVHYMMYTKYMTSHFRNL